MIKKSLIGITLLISGLFLAITASAATTCILPSTISGSQIVTCATPTGVSSTTTSIGNDGSSTDTNISTTSPYIAIVTDPFFPLINGVHTFTLNNDNLFIGGTVAVKSHNRNMAFYRIKLNDKIIHEFVSMDSVKKTFKPALIGENTISVQDCNFTLKDDCSPWSTIKFNVLPDPRSPANNTPNTVINKDLSTLSYAELLDLLKSLIVSMNNLLGNSGITQ